MRPDDARVPTEEPAGARPSRHRLVMAVEPRWRRARRSSDSLRQRPFASRAKRQLVEHAGELEDALNGRLCRVGGRRFAAGR
jgi:hypothetical protein